MKKSRMVLLLVALMGLLAVAAPAQAALQGFSPTGAVMPPGSGSPGVPIGAPPGVLPAWYQDINGVSVQPCLNVPTCGLIGLGDPMFNEALPLSYPTNFPSEAFYSDAVAIFALAPSPVNALVVLGLEYTFIDAVTGALIGAPPRPANALAAPFQRQRLVATYPVGVPAPTAGNFTITHPWGVTTFPFSSAKCVNNAGGVKCSMTQDLPLVGAIPPSFAAALGTGVVGSQSTFLKDPLAPPGFLGSAAATAAYTGAVAGSTNSITVTDPLGNTGTTTSLTLLVGQLVGLTAAPATVTFPVSRPSVTSAPITVTVTNPSAVSPAIIAVPAVTGANAVDFTLLPGTPADCLGAGANLAPSGTCTFGVQFFEAAPGVNGTKSAVVSFPVTTPLNMPPVLVSLAGTIDSVAPTVVTSLPANGEPNWPANSRPHITFSEPVTGVSGTTFTILGPGGVDVGGTVTLDPTGKIADYAQPAGEFVPGATYTGTLTTAITDIAGNPLQATAANPAGQNFVFTFTAGAAVTTPPSVISTEPTANSTGARVADPITVTFAGSVDPNTINATTFFLSEGVTGSVTYDQATRTAILKPDKPLDYFHSYTATVKGGATGVKSLGQVPMAADFTWAFLTNGAPGAPSLYLPADQAKDVAQPVVFQWIKSKDADGEAVTYHLWYCTNPSFFGCTPVDVTETTTTAGSPLRNTLAGLGGYGAGMMLAGFAIVGGVRFKRKIFFFIAVLAISVMAVSACGTKTNTETVTAVPDPATLMSKSVSNLKSGTTYWWKVVADDGNGALIESENRTFTTL